jgi:hypothetical protein
LIFRVAGVARRFPGTASLETADFVVADRPALVTALNASSPGTGFTTELWLSGPRAARAAAATRLAAAPFTVLAVASQAVLERQLRTDPVARAAVAMLEAAAVTALVLALLGLLLGVVAERSDDRAELFDLEAQGLAPAQLRRQLRLRALVAAASGAIGGVLIGLVLSALVVGFVELTANATAPEPPLVLSLDWAVVGTAAAAVTAAAILLVVAVTGRAFRQATPGRYGEGGA